MKRIAKLLAVGSIVVAGTAIALEEPLKTPLIALGGSLNVASLYLMKDGNNEKIEGS